MADGLLVIKTNTIPCKYIVTRKNVQEKKNVIEFVLVVYMGSQIINQTQTFEDMDKCLYFATKLSRQPAIYTKKNERKKITAICKPINKT